MDIVITRAILQVLKETNTPEQIKMDVYWVKNSSGENAWQWKTTEKNGWIFMYRRKSTSEKWRFVSQIPKPTN